jgi:excinuclease ABC subunit A
MCPTSGISYQNPEPNLFSFNSPKGACDHCKGLGTVNEINAKRLFQIQTVHKSRWFCSIGEYKSWIFKQLEIIGEKFGSKLLMLSKNSRKRDGNDFEWRKEKFTINSKDLGVARDYKIDFEGISHFIKNQYDESGSTTIKRWAKEFMDEIPCPVCEGSRLKKEAQFFKIDEQHHRVMCNGHI